MTCRSVLLMRRALLSSQLLLRMLGAVLGSDMACFRQMTEDNAAVASMIWDSSFSDRKGGITIQGWFE